MTVDHQNSGDLKYKPIPGSADPLDDEVTQIDIEKLLRKRDLTDDFKILMMKYDCALTEVRTRLGILNKELSLRNKRNPFESIKMRLKTPVSIFYKLENKGADFNIENINKYLSDIAGIRVICSFVDDIYMLADCLERQDDIRILQRKDYIETPKDTGYRSLHLIIEVPIYLTETLKQSLQVYPVSVVVRCQTAH